LYASIAVLPLWSIPLGVVLIINGVYIATFFVTMGVVVIPAAVRVWRDIRDHGVHNDRWYQ
jgi:hypothetical protein